MKEDQNQVFCHSNVSKEADLLFFEEKAAFDSNEPSTPEIEISPLGSSINPKDQFFLSDISSAAEVPHSDPHPDSSVIKCELHELTVYNVVKDICVDEGGRAVDKISIESWTGDPDPACFPATLPSDQDKNRDIQEDDDSKFLSEDQSKPRNVDDDVADECTTKEKEDTEPIVPDCLKFSSKMSAQMPSPAEKSAEKIPESVLNSEPLQLEDKANPEDKSSNYLSIASSRSGRFTDGETSFSAGGSLSALVGYSGSVSLRSDSSTTSTRSFAFPVLQSEWNGSPVRMAKPQKKRGWRHSILCCRF